ncbi:MAG: hypothetical protein HYT80_03940 [Euryarchaeota archaeon]|nr:hypothetical protein [Euryarchaeota archaeon]
MRRTIVLALVLVLCTSTSGCLRDEIFPEPFEWKPGKTFSGRGDTVLEWSVPSDAQRIRFWFAADFSGDKPILGEQAGMELRVRDPQGTVAAYKFTKAGETRDTFVARADGPWTVSVSDPGAGGAYAGAAEWFVPKYEDWAWWQVWKD